MAKKSDKPATKEQVPEDIRFMESEDVTRFTDYDIHLFKSGKHYRLYEKMGAHVMEVNGVVGTYFAVWAPNARYVSVLGNFNGWNRGSSPLSPRWDSSGIWEGWLRDVGNDHVYKYFMTTQQGQDIEKADPFAFWSEVAPRTASIVRDTFYEWHDDDWVANRVTKNSLEAPFSVYEVHLDSWARDPANPERHLTWQEIGDRLVPYLKEMGFTHAEFMPVMEHPYPPSWGYQITGYFSCSARNGTPQELMHLIDSLHQAGIGVLLDWVPSHFPGDAHGLFHFDGTSLYEHQDPRQGYHPDWKSYIFNYGRNEVRSFLISNAFFWLDRYHADGLRVDAVASMLYLDYSRNAGEWIPNQYGERENLEAVSLLKEMNTAVYEAFPGIQTIAEESTAFAGVSRPVFLGGLGFGMKWMMGWMNDTLKYFEKDSSYRKWHHDELTFSLIYAFTENFMLPLSHDEVVYGKKSLVRKMPGDEWQQFANLRLLFAYMFTHPGTKLIFMGGEFGQTSEWDFQKSLDWHLLEFAPHKGIFECVKALNHLYRAQPALYELSFAPEGFEWINTLDYNNSVLVYKRKGKTKGDEVIMALNFTPIPRENYRIGVPAGGNWHEIFNTDDISYYGSGILNNGKLPADHESWNSMPYSLKIKLPPLAAVILKKS